MTKTEYFQTILGAILIAMAVVGVAWVITVAIQHAIGTKAGYVYAKDYTAGYTTHSKSCDYDKQGNITNCDYTNTTYPERYTLYFKDGDKTNWSDVPDKIWYGVSVNQWFDSNCMCVIPK